MIEIYEQKILLEYFKKFIDVKMSDLGSELDIDDLIDIIDSAKTYFKRMKRDKNLYNFQNLIKILNYDFSKDKEPINVSKYIKKVYEALDFEIKEMKVNKISKRQRLINYIAEIFELTEEQNKIFGFCVRRDSSNTFSTFVDRILDFRRTTCLKDLFNSSTFFDALDGIKNKGLIYNFENNRIQEIFKMLFVRKYPEIDTKKQLIDYLIGENLKSNLKSKDFDFMKDEFKMLKNILSKSIETNKKGVNILFYGVAGTGKTEIAKVLAKELKASIVNVNFVESDCDENNEYEANRSSRICDFICKNNVLKNIEKPYLILFDEAEDVLNNYNRSKGETSKAFINNMLENNLIPTIWTTNYIGDVDKAFLRRMTYSVKFEVLSDETRLRFWQKQLKKHKFKVNKEQLQDLNKKYKVPQSVISNAVNVTKMLDGNYETFETLIDKSSTLMNRGISAKINKTENCLEKYDFNLINTDIKMDFLTEKIKKTGKLNFSLCLYGEPGTGKSEYAKKLAQELDLNILFKRASDLKSCYVGLTEQNIAKAFKEAKEDKAVLIIDEADSFFQSRYKANKSWEISEVNEMLTQMENIEYPFICTTNFMDNLDEASLRRFTFKIKFNFLEKNQIKSAFKNFFGKELDDKYDLKGVTAGDFATVKKKNEFLELETVDEIIDMLKQEIKLKKSKELQNTIGFNIKTKNDVPIF